MSDVTGRVYEAFTEFILRKLGYRDEWTSGNSRQYLYEKHREALCHTSVKICPYARECDSFSKQHKIPYGPWYDPDFFIIEANRPVACFHITHWSSPPNSPFKFWRTIEDHFQHKIFFGSKFLSVNLVFEALDEGAIAYIVPVNTNDVLNLHGWKPAIGTLLSTSFDATIVFPRSYSPLALFAAQLPQGPHGGARKRRELYNQIWSDLYNSNTEVSREVNRIVKLFNAIASGNTSPRYSDDSYSHLQSVCYSGRLRAANIQPSNSRYRKGLQQAFILRELIKRKWRGKINADTALWKILEASPRFPRNKFATILGLPSSGGKSEIDSFIDLLLSIPVRVDQYQMQPLLRGDAGLDHLAWDPDFLQFILGMRYLDQQTVNKFQEIVTGLFETYCNKYGMTDVLDDLFNAERINQKVSYIANKYVQQMHKTKFIDTLSADMLTPGEKPPHQIVVPDIHNWPLDVLLLFYRLGSFQHMTACLPNKFENRYKHSLRPYAFNGDLGRLVNHLTAGVRVGQFFTKGAQFTESKFYSVIWPLLAECLWEAIQKGTALTPDEVVIMYRYKKAMRIISSPDLEPIAFLFRRTLPNLIDGPKLRGAFNQLSAQRGWSNSALMTSTAGKEPNSGAIIQTQTVVGRKHIADKTRELAARLRSVHLRCGSNGIFEPEHNPGIHYLVVDGDWPIESKVNLFEAGFTGIYEIAELYRLSNELTSNEGVE